MSKNKISSLNKLVNQLPKLQSSDEKNALYTYKWELCALGCVHKKQTARIFFHHLSLVFRPTNMSSPSTFVALGVG